VAALVLSLLPLAALGKAPSLAQLATLAPWLLLAAAGFLIPVMSRIYWGSRNVDPGRLGIPLQVEALMGIAGVGPLRASPVT